MNSPSDNRFLGDTQGLESDVPLARIIDPAHYELEVERIFRRSWLVAANTFDLPKPGSYLVVEMPMFKTSVLLLRGRDDKIRAFHNMCIHRGNKLVREGQGVRATHSCNFHGWTYSTEGKLVGVTDRPMFGDRPLEEMTLPPVHCEVWNTFVFVNFAKEPRETLAQWLETMAPQFDGYFGTQERNNFERINSLQCEIKGSWHLNVNAFTEGYHTMFIHRNTVPDYQGGAKNPMRHRPHMELMRRHSRYSAPANPDRRVTPAEAIIYGNVATKLFPEFRQDLSHLPAGVNPGRVDPWAFDVIELFPCHVLLNGAHWHMMMWMTPVDAGTTLTRIDVYAKPAQNAADKIAQAYMAARGIEVFREDINTIENTQVMLRSNALEKVILSKQEMALQHHYRVVQQMVAEA